MLKLRIRNMAPKYLDKNIGLFDSKILARGKKYFLEGRVQDLFFDGKTARAKILGTSVYELRLDFDDEGKISGGKCSCPYARGSYCKHMAALVYKLDDLGDVVQTEGEVSDSFNYDAELFKKEIYNESYRVSFREVASFYKQKEQQILARKSKWNEKEIAANITFLYTIRLPMGVGKKGYEFYLPFMKANDFSSSVIKESFAAVFENFPYADFLEQAFGIEKFVEPINDIFYGELGSSGSLRNIILYNLADIGEYLNERSLMGILTKASRYAVDYGVLLNLYIKKGYREGIDKIADGSYYLDSEARYKLASYYKDNDDQKRADESFQRLLWNSSDLPISVFVDYYKSLNEEEKEEKRADLIAAAEHSKHLSAFMVLLGKGNKNDLKSLKLEDFVSLEKEVKETYPEDYLLYLLSRINKKVQSSSFGSEDFDLVMEAYKAYPLVLSTMMRENNQFIVQSMNISFRRQRILPLLREYGLLKEARIFSYRVGE